MEVGVVEAVVEQPPGLVELLEAARGGVHRERHGEAVALGAGVVLVGDLLDLPAGEVADRLAVLAPVQHVRVRAAAGEAAQVLAVPVDGPEVGRVLVDRAAQGVVLAVGALVVVPVEAAQGGHRAHAVGDVVPVDRYGDGLGLVPVVLVALTIFRGLLLALALAVGLLGVEGREPEVLDGVEAVVGAAGPGEALAVAAPERVEVVVGVVAHVHGRARAGGIHDVDVLRAPVIRHAVGDPGAVGAPVGVQQLRLVDQLMLPAAVRSHRPEEARALAIEDGLAVPARLRALLGGGVVGEADGLAVAAAAEARLVGVAAAHQVDVVAALAVAGEEQRVLVEPGDVLLAGVGLGEADRILQLAVAHDTRVELALGHEGKLLLAGREGVVGDVALQRAPRERIALEVPGAVERHAPRLAARRGGDPQPPVRLEGGPAAVAAEGEVGHVVREVGELDRRAVGEGAVALKAEVLPPEVLHAVLALALEVERAAVPAPLGVIVVAGPGHDVDARPARRAAQPDVAAGRAAVAAAPPVGVAAQVGDPLAVGADRRVPGAVADHAHRAAARARHGVEQGLAALASAREVERGAVGAPVGEGVVVAVDGDPLGHAARRGDDEDVVVAKAVAGEGDLGPVGAPAGMRVVGLVHREPPRRAARRRRHPDVPAPGEGELAAVRAEGRVPRAEGLHGEGGGGD